MANTSLGNAASGNRFEERGNSLPAEPKESSNFTLMRKSHPQVVSASLMPAMKLPGDDDKGLVKQK